MGGRNPSDHSATLATCLWPGPWARPPRGDPLRFFPSLLSDGTVFALKTTRTSEKSARYKIQGYMHAGTLPEIWTVLTSKLPPLWQEPSQITSHRLATLICHCRKCPVTQQLAYQQGAPSHPASISLMGR